MFGSDLTQQPRAEPFRRRSWSLRLVLATCLALVVALYSFTPAIVAALDDDNVHVLSDENGLAVTSE